MFGNIMFELKLNRIKKKGERYKKEKKIRDAYEQYWPEKKERKVSNVMLVVIIIAIVGYFVADFILQKNYGIELSPTLTTCWFSFWGVEIVALAGIRVSKVIKKPNDSIIESASSGRSSFPSVGLCFLSFSTPGTPRRRPPSSSESGILR